MNFFFKIPVVIILVSFCTNAVELDTFGITKFFPDKKGCREWNSAHWNNGMPRLVKYDGDASDPTGWTDNHSSSGNDSLYIDGNGLLKLQGGGPRFHINSINKYYPTAKPPKVSPQFFCNTEVTGYYRRLTTGGAAYDGAEIQVRTDPLAHASSGGDNCDATGLAARFRDDGKWDFEKELKHSGSTVYSNRYNYDAPLFAEKSIPLNKWIGMKYITYNLDNDTKVKLDLYIDTVSDVSNMKTPAGGGHWEHVGEMIDSGSNWPGADISGCPDLTQNMAVTKGHGTILLRTDNEACVWTMLSVREIDVNAISKVHSSNMVSKPNLYASAIAHGKDLFINLHFEQNMNAEIFSISGLREYTGKLMKSSHSISIGQLSSGFHILKISGIGLSESITVPFFCYEN